MPTPTHATPTAAPTAADIIQYMQSQRNDKQRQILMRFFKTAKGQYGEGDQFLGLRVPQTRQVARHAHDLPVDEIPTLLHSPWHEVRLCGLLLLVAQFERAATKRLINDPAAMQRRDALTHFYLAHADSANNWDLVDLSAPKILGHWLMLPSFVSDKRALVDALAHSPNLWRQRISMVCTWKTLQMGDPSWCLRYAEIHLHHSHDLMHKAVGWMLREMGKRVSIDLLRDFLRRHAHHMPRTTLRYAIEHLSPDERQQWMQQ